MSPAHALLKHPAMLGFSLLRTAVALPSRRAMLDTLVRHTNMVRLVAVQVVAQ